MNLFDGIQDNMFDTVTKVMGYNASWTPSTGGSPITGPVLLKEPTKEYDLNGVPFSPDYRIVEWRKGYFPGLYEAVRDKRTEIITVNGVEYWCRTSEAFYDGRTYRTHVDVK